MHKLINWRSLLLLLLVVFQQNYVYSQSGQKLIIIVIDGARYTETFGDPDHTWIPRMTQIASEGSIVQDFQNDGITYTNRAIPALWCGAWTLVRDTVYQGKSTQYSVKPSIFECFRKQKQEPSENCFYVLKYLSSLWLPSFDPDYGPEYWPAFYSQGNDDDAVCNNSKYIMDTYRPDLMWVYLADVDHAGHSGDWNYYTSTLWRADSIVGELWEYVNSNPFYQGKTTLIVTNDHGRHDDEHGGFKNHGCGCEGCRRIQFLAVGPNIKEGFISNQPRQLPDMAVTAAHILGFEMEKSTGQVMHEILSSSSSDDDPGKQSTTITISPNPFSGTARVELMVSENAEVSASIYNLTGNLVKSYEIGVVQTGVNSFSIDNKNECEDLLKSGVYLLRVKIGQTNFTQKIIVL